MYAYEREKIRKEQDELLKNSYSPNTIYIDNTSEKNDKRFEFNSEVDEKEKETLLSVISIFMKEEPNDDIGKIIEVMKKVKNEVRKENFFENNDIKTLINYISSYETISKEKYGIVSDILE